MPNYQTGFYFSVSFSKDTANADAAFQEVSGLSVEMGVEEVVSGGENRFKYRLPSVVTYPNLVLKRGIVYETSPLMEWCQTTLSSGNTLAVLTKDIMLSLLDENGKACMTWSFVKAYPLKWSVSDLKSQESSVLIENLELAYQYFRTTDPRIKPKVGRLNLSRS